MSSTLNFGITISMLDKFTAPVKKIVAMSNKMTSSMLSWQKEMNGLSASKAGIEAYKRIETQMGKTSTAMTKAKNKTADLGRAMAKSKETIKKLQEEAKKSTSAITKGMNDATEATLTWNQFTSQRMSKYMKEMGGHAPAIKKISAEYKVYKASINQVSKSTKDALNPLQREQDALKKLQAEFKAAAGSSGRLKNAHKEQRDKLRLLRSELRDAGIDTRNLADAEQALGKKMDAVTKKIERQATAAKKNSEIQAKLETSIAHAASISFAADAVGRTGDNMVSLIKKPLDAAIMFESKMAEIKKVVQFDSPKQFKKMHDDILALTTVVPMSVEGIADIIAIAGQSNIAKKDLLGFAEQAAKMGVAFDLSGKQSGAIMAGWRSSLNLTLKETYALADAVNFVSNKMNAKAGDLSQVISRVGAVAAAAGLTREEMVALGASMLSSGTSPEIASTAMKNMVLTLTAGTSATKAQSDSLAALGLNASTMAGRMQVDAKGAIIDVFKAIEKLDKAKRPALLKQLFGLESVESIAPILSNLKLVEKAFTLTADKSLFAGSMLKEFLIRSKTTEKAMVIFNQRIFKLNEAFGALLLPALNAMLLVISPVVEALTDLAARFPNASTAIMVMVGVVGGIALILAPVLTAVAALTTAFAYLRAGIAKMVLVAATAGDNKNGGKGNKLTKVLKGGGYVGAALAVADIASVAMGDSQNKAAEITKDASMFGGAIAGGYAGAAVGTMIFPVVGTAIGAGVGSLVGGFGGDLVGGWLAGLFEASPEQTIKPPVVVKPPTVTNNNNNHQNITINTQSDNPQAIKDAVVQALDDHKQQQASRVDGLMLDYQGAY